MTIVATEGCGQWEKRITFIARKEAGHSKKPGKNCKEKTTNARKIVKNNKKEQVQESTKKAKAFGKDKDSSLKN
jgi:hypothetical protein